MNTNLIGVSSNILQIRRKIEKIGDTGVNLIILGETGVGKEVVAKLLFEKSNRYKEAFVKVNCAALPATLIESEMFGYERGAFTGAERMMRGKFEQANGGVLFLDEIGDMSLPLQSKLLHALQDGTFSRLGSENHTKSEAWVIAATNRDLEEDVRTKKFRADLFHRISAISIYIEPLRNRKEDIPHLIRFYLEKYSAQTKGKNAPTLSSFAINKLMNYHWPGNVRELQNVLRRLVLLGESEAALDDLISNTNVNKPIAGNNIQDVLNSISWVQYCSLNCRQEYDFSDFSLKEIQKKVVEDIERRVISYTLEKTGWNRSRANRILKISYKSLLSKIQEHNLRTPRAIS
ncbi:MAG: sigma-54-dependent Fis family transcriptional regulator [Desulfobacterales bacterium]|nr:MAG: sigma-54-dependent Fis family transcriptional regulator [Desulfobacterales bacterium]